MADRVVTAACAPARRFLRAEHGAALVELAVALPLVLFPLAFGVVEFGRALYEYNAVSGIARDGARFGAALSASPLDTAAVRAQVVTVIGPAYLGAYGVALQPAQVQVVSPTTSRSPVTVRVLNVPYSPFFPVPAAQSLQLAASATFRREW